MGRTQKVLINRFKAEDKNSKKILANDIVETVTYKTTVKNTSSASINIQVEDQLPISQDEEIKVTMLNTSKALTDEMSGMLTWDLNLKPGESRDLTLSFSVQYPKNKAGKFNLFNGNISKRRVRSKF